MNILSPEERLMKVLVEGGIILSDSTPTFSDLLVIVQDDIIDAKAHRDRTGEQTCKVCGVADGFNFTVSDEEWESIVNPELKCKVLCLKCFDKMASNAQKKYTITDFYFAGEAMSFQFSVRRDSPDRENREELVEQCMPMLERFEEVEKQAFYPIPAPKEFSATIRIYASTMSREAVRKTLALFPDIESTTCVGLELCCDLEAKLEQAKREELVRVINWMDELCPHTSGLEEEPIYKPDCSKCWQALKDEK